MTVLSSQTIRTLKLLEPLVERAQHESGCSYGLSTCGYDVRLDQDIRVHPGSFCLASTLERFTMPIDVVGIVHDKSTWARRGIAVQNTVIEPGWTGFLTLEISCNITDETAFCEYWGDMVKFDPLSFPYIDLRAGTPIAQILFHRLDEPSDQPYPENGKYQNQERGPVAARDGRKHG